MTLPLLRPLLSLWAVMLSLLLLMRFGGILQSCFCFIYSAPPRDYGLTVLILWDASTDISIKLAEAPFIGDVIIAESMDDFAYVQTTTVVQMAFQNAYETPKTLDFTTGGIAAPHLSPNGRYMSYSLAPRSGEGLYLYEISSNTQEKIAPYPLSVAWLPDSQSLLYSTRNRHEKRFELYRYNLSNAETQFVFSNEHGFFDMDLSPDGTKLLYIQEQALWLYDFTTDSNLLIEAEELSRMPRWSSDNRFAYQIRRADGLYLRIVDSTGIRTIAKPSMNPMHSFIWWQAD